MPPADRHPARLLFARHYIIVVYLIDIGARTGCDGTRGKFWYLAMRNERPLSKCRWTNWKVATEYWPRYHRIGARSRFIIPKSGRGNSACACGKIAKTLDSPERGRESRKRRKKKEICCHSQGCEYRICTSSLCRVGFVEKDDISPIRIRQGSRGEDPSRVFYFPRPQGYRSSSTTVKEDETTPSLAPFRGERFARPSRIPASLSPLCFQGHPLPSLSKRWLLATKPYL